MFLPSSVPISIPVDKVGSVLGLSSSAERVVAVCGCVDCGRDNLELRFNGGRGWSVTPNAGNGIPDRTHANGEVLE